MLLDQIVNTTSLHLEQSPAGFSSKYTLPLESTFACPGVHQQYRYRVDLTLEAFRFHQGELASQQSPIEEQQNHCTRTGVPLVLTRSTIAIPFDIADYASKSTNQM